MSTLINEWIGTAQKNEYNKEQISDKRVVEQAMREVDQIVNLEVGTVRIGEQRNNNYKVAWKKLEKYLEDGTKQNKASKRRKCKVSC